MTLFSQVPYFAGRKNFQMRYLLVFPQVYIFSEVGGYFPSPLYFTKSAFSFYVLQCNCKLTINACV